MKTNNEVNKQAIKESPISPAAALGGVIILILLWFSAESQAQGFDGESRSISEIEDAGFGGEDILNSDTIDVDGTFSYREQMEQRRRRNDIRRQEQNEMRRARREERMARLQDRQNDQLEDIKTKNEEILQNKIGTIRVKSEKRLLKKLFNNERRDSYDSGVAAPAAIPMVPTPIVVTAPPAPVVEESHPAESLRQPVNIGISFNSSHFEGKDVDMRSDTGFSMTISRKVLDNFSMGISGGFTSMSILVKDNAPSSYALGSVDTDYQRLHVELNGKAFFASTNFFRPYVQMGVGYNRVSLNLDEEQIKQFKRRPRSSYYSARRDQYYRVNKDRDNRDEDTEKLSKYLLSGTTQLGVAFMFSQNLGLDLSAGYRYNFTNPFKDVKLRRRQDERDREKAVLANLGRKLERSGEISLNAGFTLRF